MNLLTELREGLSISWSAIRANKLRSVLTTLGIVIGVVTVTLMGTAIEALNRAFLDSISMIGADVLYVQRFDWFNDSYESWTKVQKRRRITYQQVLALQKQLPEAMPAAPFVECGARIKYKKRQSDSVHIIGTTEQYLQTSSVGLAQGRFLSAGECQGGRPVCVIGSEVATNLFQRELPVGQRIVIEMRSYEVVGVLEKQGSLLGAMSLDNQVIIPVKQFLSELWSNPDFAIQVKVGTVAQLEEAREELRNTMRRVRRLAPHDPDDFAINQQDQFVKMFHKIAGTIGAVGLFVTGLSLFVGGIGIMNIMFVSVAERTREIGVRKAIGAKRRTILIQFLTEAACICLLGGVVALAIAWPVTLLMARVMPARLSLPVAGLALLVAAATGLFAGFLPAWRAARMNPVDALRAET